MPNSVGATPRSAAPRRSYAARVFGYDIFISFALGPPPRGTRSYASDLARRLREADYTVFFSEDGAPVGNQLDSTLCQALLRSHALVVIANRETLEEPRWIRTEVEEFRKTHPGRPIVPINVGGALQDGELSSKVQEWLAHTGNIWIDESTEAVSAGRASDDVVNRLATAPNSKKANQQWRWTTRTVFALLAALAVGLAVATLRLIDSNNNLEIALRNATALRLNAEAQSMSRPGQDVYRLLKLLAAHRIGVAQDSQIDGTMLEEVFAFQRTLKIMDIASPISTAAFSSDGKRIFSHDEAGGFQFWDVQTGQPTGQPLKDPNVRAVAFSSDGNRLLSGGADGTLQVWDVQTGRPLGQPFNGHEGEVASVAFSPNGKRLLSGGADGALRLWDAQTGLPIDQPFKGHEGKVAKVAFSSDGERLLSSGADGTFRLWDAETGQPIGHPLKDPNVWTVAFSSDGKRLFSHNKVGKFQFWDVQKGQPIGQPSKDPYVEFTGTFSSDGKRFLSGGMDGRLRLLNVLTGERIEGFKGHEGKVMSVAFNSDGKWLLSGGADGTLRLWVAPQTEQPFDELLKMRDADGTVRTSTGVGNSYVPITWFFSSDGKRLLSGSMDGTLQLWDVQTGQPVGQPFKGHEGEVMSVVFSSDGKRLVSGGGDGTVRLWDAQTRQPIGEPFNGHKGGVESVAFSSDGKRLVSGGGDGTVRLWDAQTRQPIGQPLNDHKGGVKSVAFNSDGKRFLSLDGSRTLRLWDGLTGQLIGESIKGHEVEVASVAFSPDGKRLLLSGAKGTLRLWDTETGQPLSQEFKYHGGKAERVAFSSDGKLLFSGDAETLRLWDAQTGRPIVQPLLWRASEAFTSYGKQVLSGGPKAWSDLLCAKVTRNMSRKEWREQVSPDIEYHEQCSGLPIPPDAPAQPPTTVSAGETE